eukprot:SAG11_NODE_3889_length_2165_cov_0.903679_4_plen_100_part_01
MSCTLLTRPAGATAVRADQGEQNVAYGGGSVLKKSGCEFCPIILPQLVTIHDRTDCVTTGGRTAVSADACQQANLISSWREAFSAVPGTTDKQVLNLGSP